MQGVELLADLWNSVGSLIHYVSGDAFRAAVTRDPVSTVSAAATAFAAIAAALSAFLSWRVARSQRIESLEASRPELVLKGWSRSEFHHEGKVHPFIAFSEVENVGGGPALDVRINARAGTKKSPATGMSTIGADIIPAGRSMPLESDARALLFWENVDADELGLKQIRMTVHVTCWGRRHAFRYETYYHLYIVEDPVRETVTGAVARGVGYSRQTRARAVWALKWRLRLQRVPLLGRLGRLGDD